VSLHEFPSQLAQVREAMTHGEYSKGSLESEVVLKGPLKRDPDEGKLSWPGPNSLRKISNADGNRSVGDPRAICRPPTQRLIPARATILACLPI